MAPTLVVDLSNVLHRAYHTVARRSPPGSLPDPLCVTRLARGMIERAAWDPSRPCDRVVACLDAGTSGRELLYPRYKANRSRDGYGWVAPAVTALSAALRERLSAESIALAGYEADDAIASVVADLEARGARRVVVLSSDRDLLQLLSPVTRVVSTNGRLWDTNSFHAEYGFAPARFADYKALVGDPSDNIPGVPDIGEVKAGRLIQQHGDLDAIYANVGRLYPIHLRDHLIHHEAWARLYRHLVTLRRDLPLAASAAA